MQGITVAIGPNGVDFFAQALVKDELINCLEKLEAPNRTFNYNGPNNGEIVIIIGDFSDTYKDISITVQDGQLSSFTPSYQSLQQSENGEFLLTFTAPNFAANYTWIEKAEFMQSGGWDPQWTKYNNQFPYTVQVGGMTVGVTTQFVQQNQAWDIAVNSTTATPGKITSQIPSDSILQNASYLQCWQTQAYTTTKNALESIDFQSAVSSVIPPLLKSIPDSGHLTSDIVFTFGLGDSGLTFPNNQGIAIGATGISTYKGTAYSGTPPTGLPVPPPPTDHHLQMYVSDYVLNGLFWAFYMDGKLAVTVNPTDLPDPNILKVRTWTPKIRELLRYAAFDMQITITPVQPPTVEFQTVYLFSKDTINELQTALPADVYNSISSGMEGNVYPNREFLENDLSNIYDVDNKYFAQIERIAGTSGAAVYHDLQFTVTIQGAPPINNQAPFMKFTVQRTDVLENLGLGVTNNAQTLTFGFNPGTNSVTVTFNQSNFLTQNVISDFGTQIWPIGCEPVYDKALAYMGQTGTPLPIIQGFQFLFEQAKLNIESQGFIAILSDVEFKG